MNKTKKTWAFAAFPLLTAFFALTSCTSNSGGTNPEAEQTLSERLIGKWNFVESQEKKDGQWVKTALASPEAGTEEFRKDGVMAISYTFNGETEEYEMKWTLDDTTGELKASDEEATSMGTVSFSEDGDTLYIAYTRFKHLDEPGVVSTGEYRDVHLRDKAAE